jgi:hypothetical protein
VSQGAVVRPGRTIARAARRRKLGAGRSGKIRARPARWRGGGLALGSVDRRASQQAQLGR